MRYAMGMSRRKRRNRNNRERLIPVRISKWLSPMNVIIEHYQVKREIQGNGFNICGAREDLLRIASQIKEHAEHDFTYGWVSVRDPQPDEHSIPNSKPMPWA